MMDTTTPVDGVASDQAVGNTAGSQTTEPKQTTEAVAADETQVSETTSQNDQADAQAVSSEPQETQADDITEWAEKKGLPMDDPVKLAQMYRDAEKKMHEATSKSRELETSMVNQPLVDYTGNEQVDQLAAQVNQLNIQSRVQTFFQSNPDAREMETQMAEIVTQRPWLQNDLDALYALAKSDPGREAELRQAGGREALTNLAQKQQAVPPSANATNTGVFESSKITSANVDELVAKNDDAWYNANRDEILKAAYGRS